MCLQCSNLFIIDNFSSTETDILINRRVEGSTLIKGFVFINEYCDRQVNYLNKINFQGDFFQKD